MSIHLIVCICCSIFCLVTVFYRYKQIPPKSLVLYNDQNKIPSGWYRNEMIMYVIWAIAIAINAILPYLTNTLRNMINPVIIILILFPLYIKYKNNTKYLNK